MNLHENDLEYDNSARIIFNDNSTKQYLIYGNLSCSLLLFYKSKHLIRNYKIKQIGVIPIVQNMKTLLGTNFQSTEKLNGKKILNIFQYQFSMHGGQLYWVCRQSTVVQSTD